MKSNKLFFITILALTTPTISHAEDCHIPSDELNNKNIELCADKTVKIRTKISQFGLQHPVGMHDTLDFKTKELKRVHENYLEFDGWEIVATYKEPFKCENNIEIEGTVDVVNLGGPKGTKNSYKNVWIKTDNYKCID